MLRPVTAQLISHVSLLDAPADQIKVFQHTPVKKFKQLKVALHLITSQWFSASDQAGTDCAAHDHCQFGCFFQPVSRNQSPETLLRWGGVELSSRPSQRTEIPLTEI